MYGCCQLHSLAQRQACRTNRQGDAVWYKGLSSAWKRTQNTWQKKGKLTCALATCGPPPCGDAGKQKSSLSARYSYRHPLGHYTELSILDSACSMQFVLFV